MRKMQQVILPVWAFAFLILGSWAYGHPAAKPEIRFSVPYNCETDRGDRTRCLADAFKPGLSVVLLNEERVCGAKTADAFTEKLSRDFRATRLTGTDECIAVKDNETDFDIAIIGAGTEAVHKVSVKKDGAPVPKEMELKARELAVPRIEEPQRLIDGTRVSVGLSDAQPKVFRTENVTLLIFQLQEDGEPSEPGPTIVLMDGKIFRLEGACTYGKPTFFFVNDKLHLTYAATVGCCGCGNLNSFVYDLSSGTPRQVYSNDVFSN
jgi:hypothetical protein